MPGDTLVVLGREYDNVAGVKAYDDNGQTLTYIRPQGTKSISSNGTGIDVTEYASVDVAVPSSSPNLQAKTNIAPSTSSQTVTADSGYDGLSSVQINAMPSGTVTAPSTIAGGTNATVFVGTNAIMLQDTVSVTPNVTNPGYVSSGTAGNSEITLIASVNTRSSSDLTTSVGSDNQLTVTAPEGYYSTNADKTIRAASASVRLNKSTVSNHQITVDANQKSVNTGYLNNTSQITTDSVSISASELVSGSETKTENGTYDVTNLAQLIVNVSGGGGSGMTVATSSKTLTSAGSSISFTGLSGEPTSFAIISNADLATGASPFKVATVVFDGTNIIGQQVTNTSNAQVSYDSTSFSKSYSSGTLTVSSSSPYFQAVTYSLIYTYGGAASNIGTTDVQVGSGATSITFTGLSDEPDYFSCIFKSNFSTSSGYQRVIAVAYDGTNTYGLEMDSGAKYSSAHWSYTYNNGSLTITSSGTNAGGYFHQPGYYQLTYGVGGEPSPYQTKSVTYTPTTSAQTATITADTGYDALGQVNVTVNAIPSQYIVPTGNIAITSNTASGSTLNVSQYATATVNVPTGGGSLSVDTKTVTASNYPVSISFSSMKGEPKYFFLRSTSQISSSGSTTYYYIIDLRYNGNANNYCDGNVFRIGSTRRVEVITTASSGGTVTGYTWSYSGTTLTITSSAASRSASPGAFNNTYELVYLY